MLVWGGISGMVSSIRCMHRTVVLKHRQRLGQEQEKLGKRRKQRKPRRAAGLISMVFAGVDLPEFWTAGSWQEKKKPPSPEVQEEGTHQHLFAIKLRQFDSPTAHPLCCYAHHSSHPSLTAVLKYKLLILIYFCLVSCFELPTFSSGIHPKAEHTFSSSDQKPTLCFQGWRGKEATKSAEFEPQETQPSLCFSHGWQSWDAKGRTRFQLNQSPSTVRKKLKSEGSFSLGFKVPHEISMGAWGTNAR